MPRQLEVPLALVSMPQSLQINENVDDSGNKVAQMLACWPMVTVMIEFDEASGRAVADKMREIFGPGLTIARTLPDPNGRGPMPA